MDLSLWFITCCFQFVSSFEITTTVRTKAHLSATFDPRSDGRCYTSSDISGIAAQNKRRACQVLCFEAGGNCKVFIYDAPNCLFLTYMLLPAQPGDTGAVYYTDIWTGDNAIDIARNKQASGTVNSVFIIALNAQVDSVTKGHACVKTTSDCWCSGVWQKTLMIKLDKPYTVTKIRITPIPSHEAGVGPGQTKIYVGSSGGTGDPWFGDITTLPAPGTTVDVVGSGTGQYIYMQKNSDIFDLSGLCLCFVEAFGY